MRVRRIITAASLAALSIAIYAGVPDNDDKENRKLTREQMMLDREARLAERYGKEQDKEKKKAAKVKKTKVGKKEYTAEQQAKWNSRRRLKEMIANGTGTSISLTKEDKTTKEYTATTLDMSKFRRDTIRVTDPEGNKVLLMRAIKDDESGEMVANEVLDAAVVTARFRNVAERNGKVNLQFDITVPDSMQDEKWQIRLYPELHVMDSIRSLDPVYITGATYRKNQIRGYTRYYNFIKKIISDPTAFVDLEQLERFLKRNIPELYAMKYEEGFVSEDKYLSCFGVSEAEAVAHYTNEFKIKMNERRKARRAAMYRRYVKVPIDTLGLRLDSVIINSYGDFVYSYTETIRARKDLKKADIYLAGDVFEMEKHMYTIPQGDPLTFYIASLSSFADLSPHYLLKVVERHAKANASYNIEFEVGKADVNPGFGNNAEQIANIKNNLAALLRNDTFILDSILVTSYASPDGMVAVNDRQCAKRSENVSRYFDNYIRHYRDSLIAEAGMSINLVDGTGRMESDDEPANVHMISRHGGENWTSLTNYVEMDTHLTDDEKADYFGHLEVKNLDNRENILKKKPYYQYLKGSLYPKTRTVTFDFMLHRKGMTKDTVHTVILDSVYMAGVQAINDRDYEKAVAILRPYQDYNTAVAFVALDYNMSALAILENLKPTAQSEYMLALIKSRQGDEQSAVQHYLNSVNMEPSYRHRGNLDPEIKALIDTYGLFKEDDYSDLQF